MLFFLWHEYWGKVRRLQLFELDAFFLWLLIDSREFWSGSHSDASVFLRPVFRFCFFIYIFPSFFFVRPVFSFPVAELWLRTCLLLSFCFQSVCLSVFSLIFLKWRLKDFTWITKIYKFLISLWQKRKYSKNKRQEAKNWVKNIILPSQNANKLQAVKNLRVTTTASMRDDDICMYIEGRRILGWDFATDEGATTITTVSQQQQQSSKLKISEDSSGRGKKKGALSVENFIKNFNEKFIYFVRFCRFFFYFFFIVVKVSRKILI